MGDCSRSPEPLQQQQLLLQRLLLQLLLQLLLRRVLESFSVQYAGAAFFILLQQQQPHTQ